MSEIVGRLFETVAVGILLRGIRQAEGFVVGARGM